MLIILSFLQEAERYFGIPIDFSKTFCTFLYLCRTTGRYLMMRGYNGVTRAFFNAHVAPLYRRIIGELPDIL